MKLASGRFQIKMSVTRSELRTLRNKVYVRLLSSKNVKSHLVKYKFLTDIFMEEKRTELSMNELAAIKSRVKKTEEAAAQACVGDQLLQRLESFSGQSTPHNEREQVLLEEVQ